MISDATGGMLSVKGRLANRKVILVNLYLPNTDQLTFLDSCFDLIDEHKDRLLMVCSNLNPAMYLVCSCKGTSHIIHHAETI